MSDDNSKFSCTGPRKIKKNKVELGKGKKKDLIQKGSNFRSPQLEQIAAAKVNKKRKPVKDVEKALAKVQPVIEKIIEKGDVLHSPTKEDIEETTNKEKNDSNVPVIWQPLTDANEWHPEGPQVAFLQASEDEVLFSGGRGSGKSDCLIIDPLRYCGNKNFRGLIIRRTMKELRELINRAKDLYPQVYEKVKWKEQDKIFVFPSGAKIEYGYAATDDDLLQYQGQQYTWIGIDEITQFANSDTVDKLKASLRTTDPELITYFRATTNPNGPGVQWVKARWIDRGLPGETIIEAYKTSLGILRTTRKWIHSIPEDNKILMKNDPNYLASLYSLDNENLRRQWLLGDWSAIEGIAFTEFDRSVHLCEPFEIPKGWLKIRAADWGYSSLAVVLWLAVDYDNNIYVYREFVCNGPKVASYERFTADKFALEVLDRESNDGRLNYGVLDSSVWSSRGEAGETPADTMLRLGCSWVPSDRSKGSRMAGKLLIHQYLSKDPETGKPRLRIFNNCKQLIKELSSLLLDPNNPEDVETRLQDDHAYDALRYGLLSMPRMDYMVQDWNSYIEERSPIMVNPTIGM